MRILCPEPASFSSAGLEYARSCASLTAREMDQTEFEREAPGYDAVLIRFNTRVGVSVMQSGNLKAVLSPTTGLDHIDLVAAHRHGVKLYHLRGQKTFLKQVSATAELTVGLMLAVLRNLPQALEAVKEGQWEPGPFRGREVAGKVLGIVGCGRLGSKVARVGRALGMNVLAFDPQVRRMPAGVIGTSSLHNLLRHSDVVSLHVPLLPETRYMIGRTELDQFKVGAVLINTSRGAVIDAEALLDALRSKKLAAAAVDVMEHEEQFVRDGHHPLVDYARDHSNLLITPHIGGATFESVEKTDLFILSRYFKDQGIKT
jgi:D-3-phosphoglycerate dehydrogenase